MPYADPEKQREAQRDWWSEKSQSWTFRRKVNSRKRAAYAEWTPEQKEAHREKMRGVMRRRRARLKGRSAP
jgi:hypothetical protein